MTRRFALVALWVAATVVAILMASFAVRLVGDSVVAEGPTTVTRGQVEADLSTIPGSSVVEVAPTTELAPPGPEPTSPTTAVAAPPVASSPPPTPNAPSTTSPPGAAPAVVAPAGDDPVTPTTSPAPVPTTAPPAIEQSFPLVGGSVRVRCAGVTASLVSSNPNPGYAMEVRATGPERVEVRFTGAGHTSELKAWCDGASIAAEPKESGSGSGADGRS